MIFLAMSSLRDPRKRLLRPFMAHRDYDWVGKEAATEATMKKHWFSITVVLVVLIGALSLFAMKGTSSQLLSNEIDVRPTNRSEATMDQLRVTPLLAAVGARDVEKVQKLLESGINPDDPRAGRSPLIQAIMSRGKTRVECDLPIVRLLLTHGADPNRADPNLGMLPLFQAFAIGDLECAKILRAAGAQPDMRGMGGSTILYYAVDAAAQTGDLSLVDVALSWGIDKNVQLENGETALYEVVDIRGAKILQALLDRGFDPCIKTKRGKTPLDNAMNIYREGSQTEKEILSILRSATKCD